MTANDYCNKYARQAEANIDSPPRPCCRCGATTVHENHIGVGYHREAEYDGAGDAYCPDCWDWTNDKPCAK